jgi:hypothetical protein
MRHSELVCTVKPLSRIAASATLAAALAVSRAYGAPPLVSVSTDPIHRAAADWVSCNDKVYAFLRVPPKSSGSHLLEGRWYRPDVRQQEYTKIPLELGLRSPQVLDLWLQFERVNDAVNPWFTHADDEAFDGRWTLDVFWDGKKIASTRFMVRCA